MINLLPHAIREERLYGRRNRALAGYVASLLMAALLVAAVMLGSLRFVGDDEAQIQSTISKNQTEITQLESEISELSTVVSKLGTTYKLYESSVKFSEIIPKIGSLLPAGAIIKGLSLTGGNTDPLSLEVEMVSADLAPILQKNLVQSDLFEAADVNSITSKDDDSSYKFKAALSISFTGSAEAKRKAESAARAAAAAAAEINGQDSTEGASQ